MNALNVGNVKFGNYTIENQTIMITKIYINENCEPIHNDNTKLSEWEKKQVYAAYANRGLVGDQMEDDEIWWTPEKIDTDVFERTFLKPNSHIQVDLPYELINPKRGGGI